MKNVEEIFVNLCGDTYLRYELSAQPVSEVEAKEINPEVVFLDSATDEFRTMFDAGKICLSYHGPHVYEDHISQRRAKEQKPDYNTNGILTVTGVLHKVNYIAEFLSESALMVWERIDQRCGPKIPSRLYRNTANICADILVHWGIEAHVVKMKLDPEKHNGLKHQYRVVVATKVPHYPWGYRQIQDPRHPERTVVRSVPVWDEVNFDFDVTNSLRVDWVWPDAYCVLGMDARVLRNNRPVRWVGSIMKVNSGELSKLTILSGSCKNSDYVIDAGAIFEQTSIMSVLNEVSDGTSEGIVAAMNDMFGPICLPLGTKPPIVAMNLD